MSGWFSRLVVITLTLLASAFAGGIVLGAASAATHVTDLLVTCLSCGERWPYAPPASVGAGLLSLLRRRKPADTCPKCGSRAVAFGHRKDATGDYGRTA